MSLISKEYFNEQIKPEITLLNLKDFVEVDIVEKKSINEDEFQKVVEEEQIDKDVFIKETICSYTEPLDKMLSTIKYGMVTQINYAIGHCVIADMDTKTISELDCDKRYVNLQSNPELYIGKLFEYFSNLDIECSSMTDGMRIRHVLCDVPSLKHFKNCQLFQSDSLDSGSMFDKQFVYCSPLEDFKHDNNNNNNELLELKVMPGFKPALFMLLAYSTEQALPVKLELTLPDVVENNMIEYYSRVTMVKTRTLEVHQNGKVPCLKEGVKRVQTFRLPVLIGV